MPTLTATDASPTCALDARLDVLVPRTVLETEVMEDRYPEHLLNGVWYVLGRIHGSAAYLRDTPALATRPDFEHLLAEAMSKALLLLADADPVYLTRSESALLLDALAARNAAIEGDQALVDDFTRTWLGLNHPERWRSAVEMALLGDWVERLGVGWINDSVLADLIRQHAYSEHRQLQPLWERRVRGKRVAILSQPVGDNLALADVIADWRSPEALVVDGEFRDARVAAVLRQLATSEDEVAWDWATTGDTWAAAAAGAGRPTAYGETVRRKLKRLGKLHTARAAAATVRGWEPA